MYKQLDWEHAKRICEKYPGCTISAGLDEDWDCTGGVIFDGKNYVTSDYVFVSSFWATPVVKVELPDKTLTIDCYMRGDDENMPKWWGK